MAFRLFCLCLCWLVPSSSGSSVSLELPPVEIGSSLSAAHGARDSLAKSCGASCTSFLQAALAQLHRTAENSGTVASWDLLRLIAGNVEQNLVRAKEVSKTNSAGSGLAKVALLQKGRRGESRAFVSDNVPCATTAACAVKAMAANKCNYARVAMQGAYNELNVATHVLGVLVSSLCGCVHAGHVSTCALRTLPAACAFPYTVYSKAFAASVQVWEGVKAATKKCIIHRDPAIAP